METQTVEVDFIDLYSGNKTKVSYGWDEEFLDPYEASHKIAPEKAQS